MKHITLSSIIGALLAVGAVTCAWSADARAQAPAGSGNASAATVAKDGKTGIATKDDAALVEKQKAAYPVDTCVVTGKKLGEHGEPVEYLYKGRLVRFCCAGCIASFEKDPAKYLGTLDEAAKAKEKAGATAPKAPEAAAVWTCSMHPEVRESKPGKCPKCGMNLIKAPEKK